MTAARFDSSMTAPNFDADAKTLEALETLAQLPVAWESPLFAQTRASAIMTRAVVHVDVAASAAAARETLAHHGLSRAPVVDLWGHALGSVTLADLEPDDSSISREPLRARTDDGIAYDLGPGYLIDKPGRKVAELMSPALTTVLEFASITQVATLMEAQRTAMVGVVDRVGRLIGVITAADIVRHARARGATSGVTKVRPPSYVPPWPTEASPRGVLPAEIAARASHRVRAATAPASPYSAAPHRRTVLVVEDDEAIADAVVDLLEAEGYRVVKAVNGRQALRLLRRGSERPDVILLDLMMPEMNGWQFREAQLADEELRAIPVVVLTAHGQGVPHSELAYPEAFLQKPLEANTLVDIVAHYCNPPS